MDPVTNCKTYLVVDHVQYADLSTRIEYGRKVYFIFFINLRIKIIHVLQFIFN